MLHHVQPEAGSSQMLPKQPQPGLSFVGLWSTALLHLDFASPAWHQLLVGLALGILQGASQAFSLMHM